MADNSPPSFSSAGMQTPESSSAAVGESSSSNPASKPATKPVESSPQATSAPTFPPPKTDKPRPHVCTTCMRSFARLEHLKRHERSHTKEKPFECPSCTRCFARRDLLLRHQQKLHSTTTPSSRPRNGRRESTTGVANGRVRKNSLAGTTNPQMRPRANTLSHVDSSSLGVLASGGYGRQFGSGFHSHHHSITGGIGAAPSFGFRNMGMSGHSAIHGLPRLETHGLPMDTSGLRTAPPYGGFGAEFEMGGMTFEEDGNTINPHALHVHNQAGLPMDGSWNSAHQMYSALPTSQTLTEEDGFDWVAHGFENQMSFAPNTEDAIDDSSPSAMSTNSPAQFNEVIQNGFHPFMERPASHMATGWQQPPMSTAPHMVHSPVSMDMSSFFGDIAPHTGDTVSPKSLMAQKTTGYDTSFPTPPDLTSIDPATAALLAGSHFTLPFKHENVASTASTASLESSMRHSSVTTSSSTPELVTDHVRSSLIHGLNQSSAFGQRKQSQPAISSPLSPVGGTKNKSFNAASFPSTQDLQRYVNGYIKYFHPHLPFLHIATLSFDSVEHASSKNVSPQHAQWGASAGGSCLLLSIAALGSLFENEMNHSRELFEYAKKMISSYLEERRRSHTGKAQFQLHQRTDREHTPLWLVQAMLLNVIYGHNCGDKQAADAASNHCAALVSLARGAELAKPYPTYLNVNGVHDASNLNSMQHNGLSPDAWNGATMDGADNDWYEWKIMEERKRTLYAIFVLSSMLVTAYNRAPALTNSEIRLDLPCDEETWAAESAQVWRNLGGAAAGEARSVQFASALTHLLTAAQRQKRAAAQQIAGEPWQQEYELRPSSFGCLVLINALHNYIWETRQRHLGRQWTPQEIESMHAHIEPALRAWSTAWNSNPTHALERPNPFGAGPLPADSIPLLDLAYVRLFVDFGRSKEAYWQRDYDAMAKELAKSDENASNPSLEYKQESNDIGPQVHINDNMQESMRGSGIQALGSQPAPRERHLRKAAFYAADHLLASDRLGFNLDEQHARELPIQSVLCACDSAQVLAEWAATVQERVGQFVGIIGRDPIDLMQMPAILLLDNEDRKLFGMIDELLTSVAAKQDYGSALIEAREGGYGSRILIVTSEIMTRTAIWPVTKLMARSLQTQSGHIKNRAISSIMAQ